MTIKKIAVIGCPGSGKSVLAAKLANKTGLPIVFLDAAYHNASRWSSDAAEKRQQWREYVEQLVQNPEWIIDGNYKRTLEIRAGAADAIVFLDYRRRICIHRAVVRAFRWYTGATQAPGGNPGKLGFGFVRFIWTFRKVERPKVIQLLGTFGDQKMVYILTTPEQAEAFVLDAEFLQ